MPYPLTAAPAAAEGLIAMAHSRIIIGAIIAA